MNKVPDAWDDDWSNAVDEPTQSKDPEPKKLTAKQTKAQKRAQQAEFNRQFWAEAEGPKDTNYFLESRNVVPLRQEFKAAPVLLSRKGPIIQKSRPTITDPISTGIENLKLKAKKEESSDEEEELAAKQKALEEAKAQAAKDREEKQRKYEERRLELFGPSAQAIGANTVGLNPMGGRPTSRSGNSSPASLTPPGSRSSTPQRAARGGRGGRRGNTNYMVPNVERTQQQHNQQQYQQQQQQLREVYDPGYSAKPGSTFLMRREQGESIPAREVQPIREPRAPDGSGLNGAGFLPRPIKYTQD